jgi:hypothetical protein
MTFSIEYTVTRTFAGFRHPDRMMLGQTVRGGEHFVPRPCWYLTFLHVGRHFRNFPEICHVEKKNECDQGRLELMSLKVYKIENFFASDFGICVISLLVMSKY